MAGFGDIGNGLGYIYKVASSGAIVSVEANTVVGVQAMQQFGATNAPLAAQRSAFGIINVQNSPGTGSITDITINGINQIAAPIVVTSTNRFIVAEQIVAAINSYTAPGFAFTANMPNPAFAFVYVYSAPANGSAVNGMTITVSSTDPGFIFQTTPFINGSNDFQVWDDVFGYQFFLDASVGANPNVVGIGAIDITSALTVRGMQSGIVTTNKNVSNSTLFVLNRSCAFTQIPVDTGGPATANLEFIETINFIEGDIIRLRNQSSARVTTLIDASVATVAATPNLYLTDASPFALTNFNSITLQYRYDATLGPIWVETGRSIAINPITTTLAQFVTDASTSLLKPGQTYFITDLGSGAYVDSISTSQYNSSAVWLRKIPQSYTACWRPNMATPIIGQAYRYNQLVYTSDTGAVGSAPDTDTINWTLVPLSNTTQYASRYHTIVLDNEPLNLLVWPVVEERDQYGNIVIQTRDNFLSLTRNAFNLFCWSTIGSDYYGNYVNNSVFETANSDKPVYNNQVTGNTQFYNNILNANGAIVDNILHNSQIYNNYFQSFANNTIYTGLIINNGSAGFQAPAINQNHIFGGYIINNTCNSAAANITSNIICTAAAIQNNVLGACQIRYNYLDTSCFIQNCSFPTSTLSFDIETNKLYSGSIIEFIRKPGDGTWIKQCVLISSEIYRDTTTSTYTNNVQNTVFTNTIIKEWINGGSQESQFTNCNFGIGIPLSSDFQNCNISNWVPLVPYTNAIPLLNANIIVGVSSNYTASLDLDDPTIYAANVLTIPNYASIASEFSFVSILATKTIDEVVDLPNFPEVKFYNNTFGTCTITVNKVSPVAWSGNLILGAANFTLNAHATGVSDFMTMAKYAGSANMITGGVNFV